MRLKTLKQQREIVRRFANGEPSGSDQEGSMMVCAAILAPLFGAAIGLLFAPLLVRWIEHR